MWKKKKKIVVTSWAGLWQTSCTKWWWRQLEQQFKLHMVLGSKQHIISQCVYFAFRILVLFGVLLLKKTCFHKKEFSNEIFWKQLFIVFIVAPICHMSFYNQIWINTNFWKCTNFVGFCVWPWKIVIISNHIKTH